MWRPILFFLGIAIALMSQLPQFAAKPDNQPSNPSAMTATAPKAAPTPQQSSSGYRTVTLRDTWAKIEAKSTPRGGAK